MSALDKAIEKLEEAVSIAGTPAAPVEGEIEWWILQSQGLALSWLKRARQLELDDRPRAADSHRKEVGRFMKKEEIPTEEPGENGAEK